MTQRDKMRELYRLFAADRCRIISEYAAAEEAGMVTRRSNKWRMTALEYAERLYENGVSRGWIAED
jgi:hypothetical protein